MRPGLKWGLIGREAEVARLQDAIARGRLHHAYLISGQPGAGKTALALALAQTLDCTNQNEAPCNACAACRRIPAGNHPDVITVAMEPNQRELGIDAIREVTHFANVMPFEGAWRVFIIQDADRLSHEAANALLKTLEEPPPQTLFLLNTTAEERVLPTIRSRCQAIQLRRVPSGVLADALRERFELSDEEAGRIAGYAQGTPGAAVRAAQDPSLIDALFGALERLKGLLEAAVPERLDAAGSLTDDRNATIDLMGTWETWWRDLLLVHQGCTLGLVYAAETPAYQRYAHSLTLQQIRAALGAVQRAHRQLQQNAIPRLVLDVLVLDLPPVEPPLP